MLGRYCRVLAAVAVALAGLSAARVAWLMSRPPSAINHANFDRVRWGMTEGEVGAVLGCPADIYTRRVSVPAGQPVSHESGMMSRMWASDEAVVIIVFGPVADAGAGREWHVHHKFYTPLPPESFVERLRRILGL